MISNISSSSQHVQKLRKARDVTGLQAGNDPASTGETPKKAAAPKKRPSPTKKGAKTFKSPNIVNDEEDEEDVSAQLKKEADSDMEVDLSDTEESPSKRSKLEKL